MMLFGVAQTAIQFGVTMLEVRFLPSTFEGGLGVRSVEANEIVLTFV